MDAVRWAVAMTCLMLAFGSPGSGKAAEGGRRVPGTIVTMTPPAGFAAATQFSGFVDPTANASIMISELPPEAYPALASRLDSLKSAQAAFAPQGIKVAAMDRAPIAGGTALLLSGEQRAGGTAYKKWIALLQGRKTVMITIQAPAKARIDKAAIRTLLTSVALGDIRRSTRNSPACPSPRRRRRRSVWSTRSAAPAC